MNGDLANAYAFPFAGCCAFSIAPLVFTTGSGGHWPSVIPPNTSTKTPTMTRNFLFALGFTLLAALGAHSAPAVDFTDPITPETIECGSWSTPVDLEGKTASMGPYASLELAESVSGSPLLYNFTIVWTFWRFLDCQDCDPGGVRCVKDIAELQPRHYVISYRWEANGWYIDYNFSEGLISMTCAPCAPH